MSRWTSQARRTTQRGGSQTFVFVLVFVGVIRRKVIVQRKGVKFRSFTTTL